MTHPNDAEANRGESGTRAFLLLVGLARAKRRGLTVAGVLRTIPGLPGWTQLPALGGWNGPQGLEEEESAAVLLYGVHSGTASLVAERLRAAFGETLVPILPVALAAPVSGAVSLAPVVTVPDCLPDDVG